MDVSFIARKHNGNKGAKFIEKENTVNQEFS